MKGNQEDPGPAGIKPLDTSVVTHSEEMDFRYAIVTLCLMASTLVVMALLVYALQRRNLPGATPFAIAIGLSGLWSLAAALEIVSAE